MLTEIIKDPSFQRVAAMLRFVLTRHEWRQKHPRAAAKVAASEENLTKVAFSGIWSSELVLSRTLDLINAIQTEIESDVRLSVDDIHWLIEAIGGESGRATIAMLLAFSRSIDRWYSPADLARRTGDGESTWRKRAVDDARLMAQKHGKQWLIPASGLRLAGYSVPDEETE